MPPPVGTAANPASGAVRPYSRAFRALIAYLKSHPSCSSIRSWRTWDGNNDDDVKPTASQCPWVRLTPGIMPVTYRAFNGTTRTVVSPMKIEIETAVVDTNFDASAMLWFALDMALFPSDASQVAKFRAVLQAARISDLTLLQPALPTGLSSFGDGMIVGDGMIQLDLEILV